MKALTSSCSKAIVERLGSHTGGVTAVHVPDRLEFSFSLCSRNDRRRGCNFWFLKLENQNNKGLCPVHAVPSKTEVDLEPAEPELETLEPQTQLSEEQTNESKFVRVSFQLQKDCSFGEQFLIVGDDPMLGSWDPLEALPMTWSDGHVWTIDMDMHAGKTIQFKFILKGKGGDIIWQPGSDRVIQTWETTKRIIVNEDWENAELQKIVEEDQLAQSNVEPEDDSEVLTLAENLDSPIDETVSDESNVSGIEASQNRVVEEPVAEPDNQQITGDSISYPMEKPMAIVAENIGSSEDFSKNTSYENNTRNTVQPSEESADSPRNDDMIHDLVHNGNATPLENQERTVGEGSLFDFEPDPVLVPGLSPPVVPTEKETPGEAEERTTTDTSSEALESKDQNIPEFSKEQEESTNATPQETTAKINDKPELRDNEHEEWSHIALAMEDRSNSQSVDGDDVLQNDIQWGRETVKKFLTRLGLL